MNNRDYDDNAYEREEYDDTGRGNRLSASGIALTAFALLIVAVLLCAYFTQGLSLMPTAYYSAMQANNAAVDIVPLETAAPTETTVIVQATPDMSAAENDTSNELNEAEYVKTALIIDGTEVGILSSIEAAQELVDAAADHFSSLVISDGSFDTNILNDIQLVNAPEDAQVKNVDELFSLLTGEDTPLNVMTIVSIQNKKTISPKYEEKEDKYLVEGTRVVESLGRAGEEISVTTSEYINGVLNGEPQTSSVSATEAVTYVVRLGTQKVSNDDEPNKKQGKSGKDAGELVFKKPVSGTVILNFGQVNGVLHLGLDYDANEGTEVVASCAGIVVCVMERGGYGLMVEIDHGNGFVTRYAHLATANVNIGDSVAASDVIGTVGQTGNADRPFLHFELRIDGEAYNPRYYLP